MEVALRRRLEGVADVSISQRHQTAEVSFASNDHLFSPKAFRDAVNEALVIVRSFEIEACGVVQETENGRLLVAGRNTFVLIDPTNAAAEGAACITGALDETSEPPRLEVKDVAPAR